MTERHLASASDFSPAIIHNGLQALLQLVADNGGGGRNAVMEAIRAAYFSSSASSYSNPEDQRKQQLKRAANVLISLREYGLLAPDGSLAEIAQEIVASENQKSAASTFARHILTRLDGLDVLRAVQDLQRQRTPVTKDSLAAELRTSFGFAMPRDTTKHTAMLNWLRVAEILPERGYEIQDSLVKELTGVSPSEVDEWQMLPLPQRAFLLALKRQSEVDPTAAYPVKGILDAAELEYGTLYKGAQTAKVVIAPLVSAEWVAAVGGSSGRGAKSGSVVPRARLQAVDLSVLQGFHVPPLPPDLRQQLGKSLDEIKKDLIASDTFVAGIALELLALRMAIALALAPTEMRKRDDKTGGGEVDLLAEGVHLHYSRWLFQCKNQRAAVSVSTLAKEVGMAVLLRAHVIVLATTGRFADSVAEYARQVAETTTMQVVLVDGQVVRDFLAAGDGVLKEHFRRVAGETLVAKRPQAAISPESLS